MRRKENNSSVTKIYPLFSWTTCEICRDECRREYMWRFLVQYIPRITTRYLCMGCAPTEDKANKIVKLRLWVRRFIPPPSPPPLVVPQPRGARRC